MLAEGCTLALLQVDFYSDTLERGAQFCAVLPDKPIPESGFPTLYLLHGMSDDYTVWTRRTSIERYADERNLAVVMPDTRLGWYTNTFAGEHYFDHVSDEIVRVSRRMLPGLSHRREDTFIAGISMGGYGALRCALGRPDQFSKAASLSGALDAAALPHLEDPLEGAAYWRDVFGPIRAISGSEHDLFCAAQSLKHSRPKVWMWCGTEDFLYAINLHFRDHLRTLGYDLTYSEGPGDHQWSHWDREIQNALNWLVADKEVLSCR